MSFRVQGLDPDLFRHLDGLDENELAQHGARRVLVDANPGYPDRIEVRDLDIGDHAFLLNFGHQPADTPYRSSHAIFVRERAGKVLDVMDEVPAALRIRPISLRAFDADGNMLHADLVAGEELQPLIAQFLTDPAVAYLHAHYAKRGCYAARITRA